MNEIKSISIGLLLEKVKKRKNFFQSQILKWAKKNLRDFPWRRNATPYSVLVAEVLLKRTTSTAVNRTYPIFLKNYPNLEVLAKARRSDLQELISPLGYHIERSRIFLEIADFLKANYRGKIPRKKEDLMKIPNIGQYTAGAIMSFGYGAQSSMVDSNIERIIRRFFGSIMPPKGKFRLVVETAKALVPEKGHRTYNLALIDLGALVCRYDKPRCHICPINEICDLFLDKKLNDQI